MAFMVVSAAELIKCPRSASLSVTWRPSAETGTCNGGGQGHLQVVDWGAVARGYLVSLAPAARPACVMLRGKSSISWSEFSESLIQASMVPSGLSCAGVLQ